MVFQHLCDNKVVYLLTVTGIIGSFLQLLHLVLVSLLTPYASAQLICLATAAKDAAAACRSLSTNSCLTSCWYCCAAQHAEPCGGLDHHPEQHDSRCFHELCGQPCNCQQVENAKWIFGRQGQPTFMPNMMKQCDRRPGQNHPYSCWMVALYMCIEDCMGRI